METTKRFKVRPILGVLLLTTGTFTVLSNFSCKKDANLRGPNNTSSSTQLNVAQIDKDIISFYDEMNRLKNATTLETISINDAIFKVEGAYNKYFVKRQEDGNPFFYTIQLDVPANENGTIKMDDLTKAFWSINENILQKKNNFNGGNAEIALFDLEPLRENGMPKLSNGHYTFVVNTALNKQVNNIMGTPAQIPVNSDGYVLTYSAIFSSTVVTKASFPSDNANRAWRSYSNSDPSIGSNQGQAKLNPTTNQLVAGSENNTVNASAPVLRTTGIINFRSDYNVPAPTSGYFVNITDNTIQSGTPSSIACPYVTLGVPGYTNTTIYNSATPSTDPKAIYKYWLNTAMMNFYLKYIPGIIQAGIPAGKTFSDFQITSTSPSTAPYPYSHFYHIYYGDHMP